MGGCQLYGGDRVETIRPPLTPHAALRGLSFLELAVSCGALSFTRRRRRETRTTQTSSIFSFLYKNFRKRQLPISGNTVSNKHPFTVQAGRASLRSGRSRAAILSLQISYQTPWNLNHDFLLGDRMGRKGKQPLTLETLA